MTSRQNGVLVSMATGKALTYSLETLQGRGKLFLEPSQEIYEGQLMHPLRGFMSRIAAQAPE